MTAFDRITDADDETFTVETTVGGCTLPAFSTIEQLETHKRHWKLLEATAYAPLQSWNHKVAQSVAYKLWADRLQAEAAH